MNNNYEILETYTKKNETWSYLRHKKTGLEIAYHQCDSTETGFSFCFKTPVEDPYLGTSHVLEHCVLLGSQKYDVSFLRLLEFAVCSSSNAITTSFDTRFFFYSALAEECFKMIPLMADYVFFPRLSDEAFMQECMRVEFDPNGDGRKKEIVGVVYNEEKSHRTNCSVSGGLYYKLHELTNEKIKAYHTKYYRPDNCLFVFNGTADLDTVLACLNPIVSELEAKWACADITPRKNFTVQEFLKTVPFEAAPAHLKDSELARWFCDEDDDIGRKIEEGWVSGFSPLMSFCLDETWAYSANCWWENHTIFADESVPKKIAIPKIKAAYLALFSPAEYNAKLARLHEWQARDGRELARKIMEPLSVTAYALELPGAEERVKKEKERLQKRSKRYGNCLPNMRTNVGKDSCSITFRPSEVYSRAFYAEYAFFVFLRHFLEKRLRELGFLYSVCFRFVSNFKICTYSNAKPEKTLRHIIALIRELEAYSFTESEVLMVKSRLYSLCTAQKSRWPDFSEEIFTVTAQELHEAAVRLSRMTKKYSETMQRTHDDTYYYTLGEAFADAKTAA